MDGDTPLIDDSLHGSKDAKAVSNTKIPVRLLMLAVMHLILDDHDECLKSIFRMFKRFEWMRWYWSNRPNSKRMSREDFELLVSYLLQTYHLYPDYLITKEKHFPLNEYRMSSAEELVSRYWWNDIVDGTRSLKQHAKKLKLKENESLESLNYREFSALITATPLCIWGECFPVPVENNGNEKKGKK